MTKEQTLLYNWFLNHKATKLLPEQINRLIDLFEGGEYNRFSDLKVQVNAWTSIELTTPELRDIDDIIDKFKDLC